MRTEFLTLIEGIGNIDSAIVDEAEDYRPKRRNYKWLWAAASAACLCVVGAVVLSGGLRGLLTNLHASHDNVDTLPSTAVVVFAPPVGVTDCQEVDRTIAAENGTVTLTDELKLLMEEYTDPSYLFAVHIRDANGANNAAVYHACVKQLGIEPAEDHFAEDGTAELTRKQIDELKCPSDMSLVVSPVVMPYREILVTESYLESVGQQTLNVTIFTRADINDALAGHIEELEALEKEIHDHDAVEKYRSRRNEIIANYITEYIDGYIEDNAIPRESLEYIGVFFGTIDGTLDTELLKRLLKDERTGEIYAKFGEVNYVEDFVDLEE